MSYFHNLPLWLQRFLVTVVTFTFCVTSLILQKNEISAFPGILIGFASIPFLIIMPNSIGHAIGNLGLGIYFSIIWGLFAATFIGTINQRLKTVRNFILWSCVILGLIISFAGYTRI